MCGIAGVYALTDKPPDPTWGPLLVRALKHRGPDGEGVFADSRVLLAHTRLAIIDTSDAGLQPMRSGDGRLVIVQNGEIYNYRERRAALEAEGVRFRTASDTEVLIEALARRRLEALPDLWGMFAFALYDRTSGELLLARDRLGKKPVVYVRTPEYVAFASEAMALLQLPFVRATLDRSALPHYARFLYVPSPHTLLEGVRKLEAGSVLRVTPGAAEATPVRYWRPPPPDPAQTADAAWFERLDQELLEATRRRTVSDVPIGLFLSGGIDSNTVLAYLKRAGHHPIRTFTIGFAGIADERAIAREGAKASADQHTELVLTPDFEREIPAMLRHFGEPLGDSAVVTTYLIAREAAKHVKVILNGDGGDELFGGYPRYPFARRVELAAGVPFGLPLLRARAQGRTALVPVFDALARARYDAAVQALGSVATPAQLEGLLRTREPAAWPLALPEVAARNGDAFTGSLFAWDTGVYLPDDLLVKVDVAAMAHALENRSPLLDHHLFEHVARLPAPRRTHPFVTKPLLRRLARGRVPAAALAARKQGFQLPLDAWLRGPLRRWIDDLLRDPQATGALYREGALARELDAFHHGRADELACYRLWGLAVLETWAREFSVQVA